MKKIDLLPIGSVVTVKGLEKKLMIYGRKQKRGGTNEIYDYVACMYPEGNISSQYNFFFNHKDIDKVIFRGYEDEEERFFRLQLLSM
ncbi:DUF4176 domain-containing protein [Calditerricola satsumensis]|uniref:DUF4176 domain-containing protein n=1 Tax=Calditerricola satsumensis TaxID=373054 RepID=A0A8J3B7S8_9BACI|nr:DUF4176 domain-containing protein [Calditerricola satsumensis]GGJ91600.1 hypothetical protein GCM10007043_01640 [Calditerricola satsumensis]